MIHISKFFNCEIKDYYNGNTIEKKFFKILPIIDVNMYMMNDYRPIQGFIIFILI